ncbi:TetR/AcrR family transcriptional regulator [Cloacibacillus evryensis]|uniref:TetR/AcrR family transcriptional regulator n=1 Tax=Cloacibacillus evryensis TaxID=508460 RepID=UPI00210CC44D|nr:TetR/AcrR family transcriptional regulator [Cloacibacillus evryensis]MCQ4764728.1 TetR/AcrR family transcriptional regulator [Cloacibacillus evryensis]
MTNRQLAAAETRKALVEAAKKIICDKGLANTSIEEITEASGVSKGTFYTYFKRKEDIVFELSKGIFDEILANAKNHEGTIIEKLENYMVCFSGYIEKGSVKLTQEWIKNVVDPDISDVGIGKLKKDRLAAAELLQAGVESGSLKIDTPVAQLADTINDLLYGQMLCWSISGGAYSFEERTREFCETYLGVLMKRYLI